MSQTVCSRCLAALSESEKRRHTLLCHVCEPAWALQFESFINEYAHNHPQPASEAPPLAAARTLPPAGGDAHSL